MAAFFAVPAAQAVFLGYHARITAATARGTGRGGRCLSVDVFGVLRIRNDHHGGVGGGLKGDGAPPQVAQGSGHGCDAIRVDQRKDGCRGSGGRLLAGEEALLVEDNVAPAVLDDMVYPFVVHWASAWPMAARYSSMVRDPR